MKQIILLLAILEELLVRILRPRVQMMYMIALPTLLILLTIGCAQQKVRLQLSASYGQLEKIMEEETSKSTYIRTTELFPLCEVYAKLKRYNKLFACLDRLDENFSRGDRSYFTFAAYMYPTNDVRSFVNIMRAETYIELGDYAKAIEEARKGYEEVTLKRSVSVVEETHLKIKAYSIMSMAHAFMGNRRDAEKNRDLLVNLPIPGYRGTLYNQEKEIALAKVYSALGEYDNALKIFESIDILWTAMYRAPTLLGMRFVYFEIPKDFMHNKCLYETGRFKESKEGFDAMLQMTQISDNGEIYWMILYDRGRIAEREGNIKEALDFYTKSVDVIEQQRTSINTEASKIGFVGDKQAVYHNLIKALFDDKQYEKAFEYVERAKSRALVDMLSAKNDFALKGDNAQEVRTNLAMNDTVEYEAILQSEIIDKNKTRSVQIKTREDLRKQAPELASLVSVSSQPIAELESFIPKGEALVEYYYRGKDMYAFVISGGKLQAIKLNSEGITEDIQTFRKLVETTGSAQYLEISGKLCNRLFAPLEGSLTNYENITIVPHGMLHYLPMNALYDGRGYLIDRYSIRTMPSASAIKFLAEKKTGKGKGVLIFGNPDIGDPRYNLEYAQKEANAIAALRPESKLFLKKEATESALRNYGSKFSYIHFATHGQFNADSPLKSALLLAPDPQYNGLLTVDKLYTLNLNADLVTLSACETGLSRVANGDDLVGLTRGFLYAGAGSIVASLWKVDDAATADLMSIFYKKLNDTNKREALRTAQLETRKQYPHPYYWASFQLTGSAN